MGSCPLAIETVGTACELLVKEHTVLHDLFSDVINICSILWHSEVGEMVLYSYYTQSLLAVKA